MTAGTIMHATRLALTSWLAAIWYVINQAQAVSALGLQRVRGFGSYQAAGRGCTSCVARWCAPTATA
jgi:hypothetical protein